MQKTYISRAFFMLSLLLVPASALGSLNFYRAGTYRSETRPDKACLTSFNLNLSGSFAKKGKNGSKAQVNALDVYGYQEVSSLLNGVAVPTGMTAAQIITDNAWRAVGAAPAAGNTSKIDMAGKYSGFDMEFSVAHTFKRGFFLEVIVPVSQRNIKNVAVTNSVAGAVQLADPAWAALISGLDTHLALYGMSKADVKNTGIGDIVVNGGWTYNDNQHSFFDYIDATIRAGVSTGSGKKRDENKAYSLAAGYDGHVGFPVSFDVAVGAYEWITWGAHVGGTFFLKNTKRLRMQTNDRQTGFMKLGLGYARRDLGDLFDAGTYFKADHIASGLSLMVGYSYASQKATTLLADDLTTFATATINRDDRLQAWNMHSIHTSIDYDFSKEGKKYHPHLSVFYNKALTGNSMLQTQNV
ncbi:hypothetical protein K9K77_02110, partial [Candidatus Babeliales bacterium]|nr:hypothetical protein [Candidatus Babeliales bacterium]